MHDATHDRAAGGAVPDLTDLTDTTELDFNGQTITGLGPLSFEAQRGMSLHPSYAVSTDREPLGLLDAWMWACKPKDANGQRRDINESLRWIESYERLAEREVSTSAQIIEIIDWYRARWEIEMFFHVLKNGCRVEALQLAWRRSSARSRCSWWCPGALRG